MKVKRNVGRVSISRRLLALLFVGLFFLSVVPIASADIWHYRKPIEIDHTKVDATLTDFPVLISITDTDLKNKAQDDGDDILFVNADNTIKLDHEIEYFDGSTGELQAWVRIPSLSSTENTAIYMYYNNSECGNQQNPTGVWDFNYKMVQHLEETPAGTDGTHYDSTGNNNDGTTKGGVTTDATGQVNGADDFDGSNDYIDCGSGSSLDSITADYTICAWIKPKSFGESSYGRIFSKRDASGGFEFELDGTSNQNRFIVNHPPGGQDWLASANDNTITLNEWQFICAVHDDSANSVTFYHNSTDVTNDNSIDDVNSHSSLNAIIGKRTYDNNRYFNGTIDEVRISASARSGDWIKTEYNNQNDPSTFYTVRDEQNGNPEQPVPELSTIILFSLGLLVLAGYVVLRKKKR